LEAGRVLIDTNILVYAWDHTDKMKQSKAIEILETFTDRCLISVQSWNEFSAVMLKYGKSPRWIREKIQFMSKLMNVCPLLPEHTQEALRIMHQHQLSFWDSLIWSVAKTNFAHTIISEDGPHETLIEGIRYFNPFK
jgi:predicted nucleic acid-binding protein